MSLQLAAQHLATRGRGDDTMLVHMTPEEVRGLQALALAHGGSLTINPETGLPEAGWLSKLLPTIIGAAVTYFSGGTIPAWQVALGVGGVETARTGDLSKGIMAGMGAYGGAELTGALAGTGTTLGVENAVASGAPAVSESEVARLMLETGADKEVIIKQLQKEALEKATTEAASRSFGERAMTGAEGLLSERGRDAFTESMGGKMGVARAAYGMAAPLMAGEAVKAASPQTVTQAPSFVEPEEFDPYTQTYRSLGRYKTTEFPGFASLTPPVTPRGANGGLTSLAEGGAIGDDFAWKSEPVIRMADGGVTREQVLQAYKTTPGATLNPDEEAIKYWMGQGLGGFQAAVTQARQKNPLLAQQIDAERVAAATKQFSTPGTVLPSYLGINAVASPQALQTVQPTPTIISSDALSGYDYSAATPQTAREQQINDIYNRVLGRQAEQAGLQYWAGTNLSLPEIEKQIAQIGSNIGVKVSPTQLFEPNVTQQLAQQAALSKPEAFAFSEVAAGINAGLSNKQIADMINARYGKAFTSQNVADFMSANKIVRPPTISTPTVAPTPTVVTKPNTPAAPVAPNPFDAPITPYEKWTGPTRTPTITDIGLADRTYAQNEAYNLLSGYLKANPNALYSDVASFARRQGIPDMQARAAYNEFRFRSLSEGGGRIYDYLMGRADYPIKPYVPKDGPLMRAYKDVMGLSGPPEAEYLTAEGTSSATAPGEVPKDVPVVKSPAGTTYSPLAAFYFSANPDVQQAYETDPQAKTMTPEDYVAFHWNNFGKKENRKGFYESLIAKAAEPATGGGANGGLAAALAGGGMSRMRLMGVEGAAAAGGHLGDYSDGGRLLRGPGDGVSDSIPATIADKRPARLADGEFVVPARIVSELGNGSTEAGARKLYAMMDRVQAARRKSIGKGKVAKDSRADKYLPV